MVPRNPAEGLAGTHLPPSAGDQASQQMPLGRSEPPPTTSPEELALKLRLKNKENASDPKKTGQYKGVGLAGTAAWHLVLHE